MLTETALNTNAELGPAILFFSGGSALAKLSKTIKRHTYNSIHLVTTFDSGGCSAQLRKHFNMPAIGDIRNRLLALANDHDAATISAVRLLSLRFPCDQSQIQLKQKLLAIINRQMPHFQKIAPHSQNIICSYLKHFYSVMPDDFSLKCASIGNLCLTGGYLLANRQLQPVINEFTQLFDIKGKVIPIIDDLYHLVAEFSDGQLIAGQHNITGKEVDPIKQKICQVFLSASETEPYPITPAIKPHLTDSITNADLICYPPGSFYSSILANLLPQGVGQSIANAQCNKVYIPNLGTDPEQYAMSLMDSIQALLNYLKRGCQFNLPPQQLLNYVVIDETLGDCISFNDEALLASNGINIIRTSLVSAKSAPYYDNQKLSELLVSLAK
ncbi:GAK system CofD-like protein [Catenovulum sp. 2E275]|uniref:GAK system CofD-like protein n=1 Tax=Catenovulum sp. 2E275 TaxID=2980497 RepID=UPI0021D33CFD|nr:GAK system CofD-like protein [Catenovulum sp. 2E275]MCU4675897.1 GAK system CofD-like protein [Catenovulum sp. 2E275]